MVTRTKMSRSDMLKKLETTYREQLTEELKNVEHPSQTLQSLTNAENQTSKFESILNAHHGDLESAKTSVKDLAYQDAELLKKNEMNLDKTVTEVEKRNNLEIQQKGPEMEM